MALSVRMHWPTISLDRFPVALLPQSPLASPRKQTIVRVHWLVVAIASYMVLFAHQVLLPQNVIHVLVLVCVSAAASFSAFKPSVFERPGFIATLVVADTLFLSFALIVTDQLATDFYLSYFLIIIIAGFWKDIRWSLSFALAFSVFYSCLLVFAESITTPLLLRVPFMFIASVFYSYFVHLINQEQTLRKQAETDARRDFLTGLANRHGYQERVSLEIERGYRYGRVVSLLMVDIDNFKLVNDAYGHEAGDLVLQNVAAQLSQNLRSLDFVARIGGEEFAVILPETDAEAAGEVASRILATIRENPVQTSNGLLSVTVSIGVSSGKLSDSRQMLLEADHALYQAKTSGKNCFQIYRNIAPITSESVDASLIN